jgi:tetratricopeptide (TPR) repeat protein
MDMELHLARPDTHQTEVVVTCNDVFSHTFDLHTLIPARTNGLPHPIPDPVTYGKALYAALFPPDSLAYQALAAKPRRILLVAADEELDALPWEYASTSGPSGCIACRCSFVRGLPTEQRSAPPTFLNGLHIVAVASSPLSHTLAPLNIQGEWTRLTEIVGGLDRSVTLERAWPPTIVRLRELLVGQQQRVLHFMGHGGQPAKGEAVLCFEQDDGAREDISVREFVQRVQSGVFLVTLNACQSATPGQTVFSNLAKALVREQVPYALGMRFFVHDDDALAFSRDFYSNLARGVPVEDALVQARLTLAKSERAWASGNLVLYTSLTHAAPGYATEPGEPDVRDAQEDALRGIIVVLPEVQGAFQGRIDEQIHLGKWLTGDRRPRIMTLHGSGGQGKTALARVAAERFAHAWPGGVWSIMLETVPTRAVFVASLARFLGINPQDSPERADLEQQIQLRLRRLRTLLVLDNLETLDEAARARDAEALALLEFIQQLPGERTSLLCTSRHLLGWSGEQHLELSGLAPDEGAALFQQSAPDRVEEIELSLARQLSRRVDGHPLGLSLLGRAFNTSPIALSAFLADHETYLLSAENTYIGVDHRQRKMLANVAYSVRWLSPELRDTLSKLWVFHAPFLPNVAVTVLDPEHDAKAPEASPVENHLYALWQRGLLTREVIPVDDGGVYLYRLPPVMRPYVAEYLADKRGREELLKRFGEASASLAQIVYQELVRGRAIATLALQCYDDLARGVSFVEDIARGYYLFDWGWILHWLGDQQMSVAVTEQALEIAEGRDRALERVVQNSLAMMSHATGHPHEALRLYEQALLISREVGNRAGEGATLTNLGLVYVTLGQKQKALDYYEQALLISREVGNRSGEGTTLNNLGHVYDDLGQKQQALDYFEQALLISREVGNRAGEGATLTNLGGAYDDLGQKQQALDYFKQALVIFREVRDRAREGTALNNLGRVYDDLGHKQQALDYFKQALVISQEVRDPAREAATLVSMAVLLCQDGQHPQEAIANMQQALDILRATDLPQDAAGQTPEMIEHALQAMQNGTFVNEQSGASSTLSAEEITTLINATVAVMTDKPERKAAWREATAGALADAQQHGTNLHTTVDFLTALLAILDGQPPSLAADHPYAPAIVAIQDGIAKGGPAPDDEGDVSEAIQALWVFSEVSVAMLRSIHPQEKMAFMQQLTALQEQTPDDQMKALFQAIQLALLGGDLAHLGNHLTGLARQVWDVIVAGVQQDDTPSDEMPDTV